MASMTLACLRVLGGLAQHVGGALLLVRRSARLPVKTPSGEWYGPHRFSPPRVAVISMAHLSRSTAALRTAGVGADRVGLGGRRCDGGAVEAVACPVPCGSVL